MKKFLKLLTAFFVIVIVTATVVVVDYVSKNPQVVKADGDEILNEIVENLTTASQQKGTLSVTVNDKTANFEIAVRTNPFLRARVVADFCEFGVSKKVVFNYNGEGVFVEFGGTKIKFKFDTVADITEKLNALLTALSPQLEALTTSSQLIGQKLDISAASSLEEFDVSSLSSLLDYVKTQKTRSGYALNFDYSGITASANFDPNYKLLNFSTNKINLGGNTIFVRFKGDESYAEVPYVYENLYTDVSKVLDLFTASANSVNTNNYFGGEVKIKMPVLGEISLRLNAKITLNNGKICGSALIDGLPCGIYMNTEVYTKSLLNPDLRHYVYLHFDGDKVVYERCIDLEKSYKLNGKTHYAFETRTIASGTFSFNDIQRSSKTTISLLTPVLGVGKVVTDAINLVGINTKKVPELSLGALASSLSYNYAWNQHMFTLDLKTLTGNADLSNLTVALKTANDKLKSLDFAFNQGKTISVVGDNIAVFSSPDCYYHLFSHYNQLINPQTALNNFERRAAIKK